MLLLVASTVGTTDPPVKAHLQTTATVRIERPAVANNQEWRRLPKGSRREIVIRGKDGTLVLVRITEYE
jgi:hypothetical protein